MRGRLKEKTFSLPDLNAVKAADGGKDDFRAGVGIKLFEYAL